jgi:predicted PurR-regulated permease PerM
MPPTGPSVRVVLRVVTVVVASALTLYLIWVLRKPLTWLVIAGFIAIAVSAPVARLQRRYGGRRGLAILTVYVGLILVPVLIGAVLVPPIVDQTSTLVENAPKYAHDLETFAHKNRTLRRLERNYDITGKLQEQAGKLGSSKLSGAATVLSDIGIGIVNSLFAGVTILILSVFMVGSGGRWTQAAINSRPAAHQPTLRRAVDDIAGAVSGYVAGALGQAAIAGVTAFIVLAILGVPYPAALALVVALLDLVPLVGATLGAILVGVVTLFHAFPTDTIVWAVWSVLYQQVENTIIQPRIQAHTVNVQPIIVLVAVLFGSTLFGVLGALLAIPFAAAVQICIRELRVYRRALLAEELGIEPPDRPGGAAEILPA